MSTASNKQNEHGMSSGEPTTEARRPYWTHAHHDWRFWVFLLLAIAAMIIYISSENLSMGPRGQQHQPVPGNTPAP